MGLSGALMLLMLSLPAGARADGEDDEERPARTLPALIEEFTREIDEPQLRQLLQRELHAYFPGELRRISELLKEDPEEAGEVLEQTLNQVWRLVELKEENPREYEREIRMRELENQAGDLADEIRAANGAGREELTARLSALLGQYFDLKQERMKRDIERLEKEAKHLRRVVAKRTENRDRLIERRQRQLLDDDDLEW